MEKLAIGMKVILSKNLRLAIVEKINPKFKDEFVVSYYNKDNKLCYDSITEADVLSASAYDKIKDRTNLINDILRDD